MRRGLYDPSMRTFNSRRDPVLFKIDDDTFMAVPEIPAGVMLDLAKMQQELSKSQDVAQQFDLIIELFRKLLVKEAFAKFERRLRDPDNPIGLSVLVEVIKWMLGEAYGARPTQSSLSSQEQSAATTGGPSTDGALLEESIPETSDGVAIST